MTKLRTIEKQINSEWIVCPMKDIKKGDIFRYTEGPYLSLTDAYQTENEGVWGVDVEDEE